VESSPWWSAFQEDR